MIRRAALMDLDQVAMLIRASFDPALLPYMVYAQRGIGCYLATFVGQADDAADRVMLVAVDDQDRVTAYAEFRRLERGEAHLSYICVAPEARGRGLASKLIRTFVADDEVALLHLDVFAENRPALTLYRTLGFRETGETRWFARALPTPVANAESPAIIDRETSEAAFDRHGFCELQVDWRDSTHKVGRIGDTVIRCFAPEDFADDALLAGLHRLLPKTREALLISAIDPSGQSRLVNRSLRLTATF